MSAEPSSRVRRAIRQLAEAQLTLERARAELHDAITADIRAGVTQAELVRATGYTRERIRQLTREAEARASV